MLQLIEGDGQVESEEPCVQDFHRKDNSVIGVPKRSILTRSKADRNKGKASNPLWDMNPPMWSTAGDGCAWTGVGVSIPVSTDMVTSLA